MATLLLMGLSGVARAAEIVVVGSPSDNASPTAMAIVTSVRGAVLDHPWLGLVEVDDALVTGPDARDPLRKATSMYRAARAKLDDLLIEDAAKLGQQALNGYREHVSHASDLRSLGRALELMGAIALTRSDNKAATEYIEEALALNPDLVPNPEIYNPPMIKKWQQIAAKYNAGPKGTLVIEAPAGEPAVVEIDGRYRGLAPLTVKDIAVSFHYVRVTRAGSLPWGQRVAVGKKPVKLTPQLIPLKEAAAFAAARAKAWDPDAEQRKEGMRELGKTLHCEYIVLVSTTPRETIGAPALTPVHAELYSVTKGRVLRSADAALGVRPGSAPPLARTFIDALLPAAPIAVLSGTQAVLGEPDPVAAAKRQVALGLKILMQSEPRENGPIEETCLADALCMAKVMGDAEAVYIAKVDSSGKSDAKVDMVSYVGNHKAGQISVDRVRNNDEPLLLAMAELVSLTYLELDDRRLAGDIVRTVPNVPASESLAATAAQKRSTKRTAGLITAGAGAALAIGGFVLAGVQAKTLDDPSSSGDAKSSARTLGRVGVIGGGVGVAAVITGGIIWWLAREPGEAEEPMAEVR